jgi:putative phage-type endonuclease
MTTTTDPCEVIAPAGQSYVEWQAFRQNVQGLGASEAAAAMNLHPWKSAYSLYLEKVGEIDPIEDTERMAWGRKMEPLIAAEFFDRHPELEETPKAGETFRSIEHPFMFATPDRFATSKRMGTVGVVELKNVGLRLSGDWGDYPPDFVQIQCAHQLAVTGLDVAHVAALIGGNEFRDYTLARDDALIANLIEAEQAFWQRVIDKTPPPVDGSASTADALRERYADPDPDSVVELPNGVVALLRLRADLEKDIANRETELACVKARFMDLLGDREIGTIDGIPRVTWKKSERHSIDTTALKKTLPDIAAIYEKVTPVRTLRFVEQRETAS